MAWDNDFSSGDVLTASNLNDLAEWVDWDPTYDSSMGTYGSISTNTARYIKINDYVHCVLDVTIVNKGSASGFFSFTTPVSPSDLTGAGAGREVAVTNYVVGCEPLNTSNGDVAVQFYDGSVVWSNGNHLKLSYVFKAA